MVHGFLFTNRGGSTQYNAELWFGCKYHLIHEVPSNPQWDWFFARRRKRSLLTWADTNGATHAIVFGGYFKGF